MRSKVKLGLLVAALAVTGCAAVEPAPSVDQTTGRYELKDGSFLIIDANGRMRMFDLYGDPVYMRDGVAMELRDGTVISMKENVIWKQLRTRGSLGPRS